MFTGIEEIDWASMGHAYTDSATDVPDLLWGLASDDPARRDIALDGMYGAVHHQGDVYDSTVACVPFLFELIATPTVADRDSVVGLLRSIAGEKEPDPEEPGGLFEDEDDAWVRPFLEASELIRGRAELFLDLLDDPEPGLRAALPGALAHLHSDPLRVFAVLRERLPVERDPEAVRSLVDAIGTLAVNHTETLGAEAGLLLRDIVSTGPDPETRLTALVRLACCTPDLLPDDTVDMVLEAMRQAYEENVSGAREAEPERPRTNTMVSYLRELEAERRGSLDAEVAGDLLDALHRALGDRTDLRFALLMGQLRSPDGRQRRAAVRMSGLLMTGWRAPDDRPVFEVARQLAESDRGLVKAALRELRYLAPIARCASDVLVACVLEWGENSPMPETGLSWSDTAIGIAIEVLTLQGDEQVVDAVTSVLERIDIPESLVTWIKALGPEAAAPLGPVLHRRLAALPSDDRSSGKDRLISGLGLLRYADALPLLIGTLRDADGRRSQEATLRALARYGGAAAEAAPVLRELLVSEPVSRTDRLRTAEALWAVTGDTEAVLPVLRAGLSLSEGYRLDLALEVVGSLGAAAAPLAPELRALIPTLRSPADAAVTLWRVRGNTDEVLPPLMAAWASHPRSRPAIAACFADMGPAAAPALPLIRAELASVRRHNNDNSTGNMRYDVASDEALLADCRRILAAHGG